MTSLEDLESYIRNFLQRPQRVFVEGIQLPLVIKDSLKKHGFTQSTSVNSVGTLYNFTMTNGKLILLVSGDWFDGDFTINSVTE